MSKKHKTLPDPERMDPSATDPSATDPTAATEAPPRVDAPPSVPSEETPRDLINDPEAQAALAAELHAATPAAERVIPAEATVPRTINVVFKELAKCLDLASLCKHLEANPDILDFLGARRGILPVYSDKPPPTFPRPGQLRSYDDYVDVLFTRGDDGVWHNTKLSR